MANCTVKETQRTLILTLSEKEAEALRSVLANVSQFDGTDGGEYIADIDTALCDEGVSEYEFSIDYDDATGFLTFEGGEDAGDEDDDEEDE